VIDMGNGSKLLKLINKNVTLSLASGETVCGKLRVGVKYAFDELIIYPSLDRASKGNGSKGFYLDRGGDMVYLPVESAVSVRGDRVFVDESYSIKESFFRKGSFKCWNPAA
jgi:hypothetical protein